MSLISVNIGSIRTHPQQSAAARPWREVGGGRGSRGRPGRAGCGEIRAVVACAAGMRVALCQLPVSSDPSVNLARAQQALADAARAGAQLAVFPEGTQARFGTDLRAAAEPTDGAFCRGRSAAARDHGVALVAGVFGPGPARLVYNTAVVFDERGTRAAAHRKIHRFDPLGQRETEQWAP